MMRDLPDQAKRQRWFSAGLLAVYALLLLGGLGWSLKERAIPDLFKVQLRQFSDNPVLLNSLLGALPALISMLVGPLIGAWSDRTRSALGRHIPFLLGCAPLIALSLVGLAYSHTLGVLLWQLSGAVPDEQNYFVLACMCVCWTSYSLFTIIGNALFIGLINDLVPHAIIGRFFGVLRIVSLAVGVLFFYYYFGNELTEVAQSIVLTIAALYLLCFLLVCYGIIRLRARGLVHEPARQAQDAGDEPQLRPDGWTYLLLFLAIAMGAICVLPANINSYHAIGQFDVDFRAYGRATAAGYSVSILLAWPIGWLADRYHPVRIGFAAMLIYACCMLAAWWLVTGPTSYLIWLFVHVVVAGIFLTGTASLLPLTLPRQQFSSLAALSAALTALLTVFFSILLGFLLGRNGHDYRLVFLAAGLVALAGAGCWYRLLRAFRRR